MKITIRPGSNRTFVDALWRARLTEPTSAPGPPSTARSAICGSPLLVVGIDHERVGSPFWVPRILQASPHRRRGRTRPGVDL